MRRLLLLCTKQTKKREKNRPRNFNCNRKNGKSHTQTHRFGSERESDPDVSVSLGETEIQRGKKGAVHAPTYSSRRTHARRTHRTTANQFTRIPSSLAPVNRQRFVPTRGEAVSRVYLHILREIIRPHGTRTRGKASRQQSVQVAGIPLHTSQATIKAGQGTQGRSGWVRSHSLVGGAAHDEGNASTVDENGLSAAGRGR